MCSVYDARTRYLYIRRFIYIYTIKTDFSITLLLLYIYMLNDTTYMN